MQHGKVDSDASTTKTHSHKRKHESKEDSYQPYHRLERLTCVKSRCHKQIPQAKQEAFNRVLPLHSHSTKNSSPPPPPAANMGKLCCSQEDDEPAFNLLGLLVTIVLALLLLMMCTPPRRRRCIAVYPCC